MTTSHTPGPWKAEEERGVPYLKIRGSKLGERFKIANVLEPVYEGSRQRESDETIANARLISAAPEQHEALCSAPVLSKYHGEGGFELERFIGEYEKWSERKRAAISKATGEAQ